MSQRGVPAVRFPDPEAGSDTAEGDSGEHRAAVLEALRRKLPEDHLGEAPIKPGDSVTVLKEWRHKIHFKQTMSLNQPQAGWNRVVKTSLAGNFICCAGDFLCTVIKVSQSG